MSDQFYRQLGETQGALTAIVTKEVESHKAEVKRLKFRLYHFPDHKGCDHTTACSIWRDDGQGHAEGFSGSRGPCNCGALENFHRKRAEFAQAKCAEMVDFIEGHAIDRDHSCIECGNVFGQHDEDCKLAAILKSNPGQAFLDRLAKAEQETAYHKSAAEAASKIMHQTDEVWKADKYRLTKLERVRDAAEHVVPEDCSEEQWDEFLEALASCASKEGK